MSLSEIRIPFIRASWVAASVTSLVWYLYWISYDVLVWNKPLVQVRLLNYVGLTLSVAFIFVGIWAGKISSFGKPGSDIEQIQKSSTPHSARAALVYEHFKRPDVTRDVSSQRWTIFSSMFDAVNEKEQRKLRFTKCSGCNRTNIYRLANFDKGVSGIICRKCGTKIPIQNKAS